MIDLLLILLRVIVDWLFGQLAIVQPVYTRHAGSSGKPIRLPLSYAFLPSMLRFSARAKACTGPSAPRSTGQRSEPESCMPWAWGP